MPFMQKLKSNLYLIGFMGTGKTSVGKSLAEMLSAEFLDMDVVIETREKATISEIFATHGEAYFRKTETELLTELSARSGLVVATGGGVALLEENVALMHQSGPCFLLQASAETICVRLAEDTSRPLLQGADKYQKIEKILTKRAKFYQDAADFIIDTDAKKVDEIVLEILKAQKF